jgi:pimeloyl-ACP methyl ester carboxylesterase
MKQLSAMGLYDASARLAGLASIPTLVVSGAHDRIAPPATGRRLAELIPGARYVEIEDGAHAVVISGAERVNALLNAHLEAAERPGASERARRARV